MTSGKWSRLSLPGCTAMAAHASVRPPAKSCVCKIDIHHCRAFSIVCKCELFPVKMCSKGSSCGTKWGKRTGENRCEFWHSSLVKNITDNKIWKTIPRGGGKLSGGKGKRQGWLRRGLVFVAGRVLGVEAGSGFQPQPCQHFRPRLVGFLRRAAAAHRAIGGTGFALGTGAGVTPPAPEPFQLYNTYGTCEHDTVAQRRIILSRPSEMNVLAPHYLILLSHSLCS